MPTDGVWPALSEIGAYERHFNEIQARYRGLASTWLLATFAGIGFVLSQDTLHLPFDRWVGAAALGVAGAIGIALLWNLDLMVYHRLLDAVFVAGVDIELGDLDLPPIRSNMVLSQDSRGALPRVVWFYLAAMGVLLLVAGTAATIAAGKQGAGWAVTGTLVSAAAVAGALRLMYRTTCAPSEFVEEAAEAVRARQAELESRRSRQRRAQPPTTSSTP